MTMGPTSPHPSPEGACRLPRAAAAILFRFALGCLVACCMSAAAERALAVDVEQVIWGFDGQVVVNRFNLLSVLVSNPSPQAFEGKVTLTKSVGARQVDIPLVESVYLSPHSSRWVQFHPYVKLDWEEWSLSWGPNPTGSYLLQKPRHGGRACVLLEEADAFSSTAGAIKRFPEGQFPSQITACDGLRDVVLDHVPRWEPARQRAFADWVRSGGRVHILHSARGAFPRFTGELEFLGSEVPKERADAGYIFHHDRDRSKLTSGFVEQVIIRDRDFNEAPVKVAPASSDASTSEAKSLLPGDDPTTFVYQWEGDSPLLTNLKKMSRPTHSWVLIHLLSLIYIGLVFPGTFVVSMRREGDYRYVFGALLGIVFLFSLAFFLVGRRGYGEQTTVNSVAIARSLPDGRLDVTQWSDGFVVGGGDYSFVHKGSGRIYSTCQDEEPVHGEATSGGDARLLADMPPYSSRTFGHRTLLPTTGVPATIESLEFDMVLTPRPTDLRDLSAAAMPSGPEPVLKQLTIAKGPAFPKEYHQMYVVFGRSIHTIGEENGRLELRSAIGSLALFLQLNDKNAFDPYFNPWLEKDGTQQELFEGLAKPLVARALDIGNSRDARTFQMPDNRVRLFVYAPMTEDFFVSDPRFGTQRGYVLYAYDLFFSETQ